MFKTVNLTEVDVQTDGTISIKGCITINIEHITYIRQYSNRCNILLCGTTIICVKETKDKIMSKIEWEIGG